jgi:TonB family protein
MDASEGGVRFQGVQYLREGQLVCLKFEFPGMHEFIEGTGQIVWVDRSGKGGGLQFTDVPVRIQHLIKQWLESETAYHVQYEDEDHGCNSESAEASARPVQQEGLPGGTNWNVHQQEPDGSASESALPCVDSKRTSRYSDRNSRTRSSSTWSTKKILTMVGVFGVLVAVGARLFQMHRSEMLPATLVNAELSSGPFFDLKVEADGQDLRVEWNQNPDAPVKAVGGLLTITDGSSRFERDLDPSELQNGKFVYTPVTDNVVVCLQQVTMNSALPASETVRVVNRRAFQVPRQAITKDVSPHSSRTSAPVCHPARRPADSKGSSEKTPASMFTSAGSLPEKSGTAPKLAEPQVRRDSEGNIATADPPASRPILEAGVPALPPSSPIATSVPKPPSPSAAPMSQVPSPELAMLQQSKLGGNVEPAQLIARRDPVYRKRLGQASISGDVELHYKIGTEGNVHDVKVVKGNPLLANAAVDAVKTWRYKPARLNGIQVETEATAVIVFKPN